MLTRQLSRGAETGSGLFLPMTSLKFQGNANKISVEGNIGKSKEECESFSEKKNRRQKSWGNVCLGHEQLYYGWHKLQSIVRNYHCKCTELGTCQSCHNILEKESEQHTERHHSRARQQVAEISTSSAESPANSRYVDFYIKFVQHRDRLVKIVTMATVSGYCYYGLSNSIELLTAPCCETLNHFGDMIRDPVCGVIFIRLYHKLFFISSHRWQIRENEGWDRLYSSHSWHFSSHMSRK